MSEILKIENSFSHRVRYADTDMMGVVYNGNYLTYFEIARTELMRKFGLPYKELEKMGFMLPLIEARAFYKSPAYYDDELELNAVCEFSLTPRLRFDYSIKRDGVELATGYTVHSYSKVGVLRPARPPKEIYDVIKNAYLRGINA